jgi:hypothetical protein
MQCKLNVHCGEKWTWQQTHNVILNLGQKT